MEKFDYEYHWHYAKLFLYCVFSGIVSMFRKSTWKWMTETKDEEVFTWPEVIGIVFWGDYRREKAFERESDY